LRFALYFGIIFHILENDTKSTSVSALSEFSLILIFYNSFVFILKRCLRQEAKINKKLKHYSE